MISTAFLQIIQQNKHGVPSFNVGLRPTKWSLSIAVPGKLLTHILPKATIIYFVPGLSFSFDHGHS